MGVNIFNLIVDLYLATVIATVIAFILNFRRLDKYYKKIGLRAIFNEDSLVCLLMCFIPVANIRYGLLYWNGSRFTDDEMKEYLQENDK